jgi:hypothetical protein
MGPGLSISLSTAVDHVFILLCGQTDLVCAPMETKPSHPVVFFASNFAGSRRMCFLSLSKGKLKRRTLLKGSSYIVFFLQ